jgi:hypothetical protein
LSGLTQEDVVTKAVKSGAVIIFFITQNMTLPMAWVDWWTIVHVIIVIAQVIFSIVALRKKDSDPDETQHYYPNAAQTTAS